MTVDEWIAYLEKCLEKLKIPETQKASDWESLYKLLCELKEHREREDKELVERSLEIERDDWEREELKRCPFCGGKQR